MIKGMYRIAIAAGILMCGTSLSTAHNSYTGGYSGAPGRSSCASSCHATAAGTITVGGFPAAYNPGQAYTITVKHSSGSKIINFNATTRVGSTTTVAGIFAAGLNSALYTGADGGVYAGTHLVDSVVFVWTAPPSGSGAVNFYLAGMQGTSTGSSSGQSTKVALAATENTTGVKNLSAEPAEFALLPNYPNPFNPSTEIRYQVPDAGHVMLTIFDAAGREIGVLLNETKQSGTYSVRFDPASLSSGVYIACLNFNGRQLTRKMLFAK
jgi:hypothetical protein